MRSIQENDLILAHNLGNQILALNTMAEERHKELEIDFNNLKIELENANTNINIDERIEASERFLMLQSDFDDATNKLKEKDTKIKILKNQIGDLISNFKDSKEKFEVVKKCFVKCEDEFDKYSQILEANRQKLEIENKNLHKSLKANDVKITSLENENKTLKDKSICLEGKCHDLDLENKGYKNKLAILDVNAKTKLKEKDTKIEGLETQIEDKICNLKDYEAKFQKTRTDLQGDISQTVDRIVAQEFKENFAKIEALKNDNKSLNLQVQKLRNQSLKSQSDEQQNLQIEDCVACGGRREELLAFFPCLHAKTCKQCCKKILDSVGSKCPYCRVKVTEFKKVFV